ncbi:MAG: aldo/keto reductase [Fibrella sp.]|nr:aldo/keto reductase [Armatimonadota bacterium]
MDTLISPEDVPTRTLYTGATIPGIGLGTFGSDKYTGEQVADAVRDAIFIGYRHIDCAAVYANEHLVGEALADAMKGGVRREDLFITSKLWNDKHGEADVIPACEKSLRDLGLDYLDLYLIHWPFPNYHAPKVDVSARDPHAKSYIHESYMRTWRQLETLVDRGLVRHIGTSNMTAPKLELVLRDSRIPPAVNEMELHPHFQQPELFRYVVENGMVPIGYSPLGSPSRPDRDRTPDDTVDMEDPVILEIAGRRGISPASVCIRWAIGRGQIPIPFSVKHDQYQASLEAAIAGRLTDEEMQAIAQIDHGNRLIKGHVFLWKDGQTWEALWDKDGVITPA